MRLLIPTLCGAALLAGTVQASAHDRRGHAGHHVRIGGYERHMGPSVSVRVYDRGYRSSYYGYGPSYGFTSYGYGPSYGYSSFYGPSYGYRSTGYYGRRHYDRDYGYGYGYVGYRSDDDDCD